LHGEANGADDGRVGDDFVRLLVEQLIKADLEARQQHAL